MEIEYEYNAADLLGEAEQPYDLAKSCEQFEKAVRTTLRAAYRKAHIKIVCRRGVTGWSRRATVNGYRDTHAAAAVEGIVADVWATFTWVAWA